jgi:RHS repeat-associated protein
MSSVAKEDGSDVAHELLSGTVTIGEPGYIYVFLSNEQGANPYEVYFDDFNVEHTKSPVIQAEDYYPFGLTYNNYQRENSIANNYLFQDKEWQDDLGLNVYDFEWRQYDPIIGRTTTQDPHSDNYLELSPYSFFANNPISTLDPTGMDTVRIDNTVIPDATLLPEVEVTSNESNQEDVDDSQDDNGNNAAATASVGALMLPMEAVGTSVVVTVSAPVILLTAIFTLIPNTTGDGEMEALEKMRLNASPQDKKLTPGEIEKLEEAGHDVHELKGGKRTGQTDLYKTPNGDIVVKGKGGVGPGEPTGININDL